MRIPKPPGASIDVEVGKTIEVDEWGLILDSTLYPHHRDDPTIIKFIRSYLQCRDIRQASREAGIAYVSGKSLRNRTDIKDAIVKLTDLSVVKHGLDTEEIVGKVKEVLDVDPLELTNEDGSYRLMREIPAEIRRAIKKFKAKNIFEPDPNGIMRVVGQLIEVEFYDRLKSAELLGREVGKFKEKKEVEHTLGASMKEVLLGARARAEERERELLAVKTIDVTPTKEGESGSDV